MFELATTPKLATAISLELGYLALCVFATGYLWIAVTMTAPDAKE